MIQFKRSADLGQWLEPFQKKGEITGFVPTMGALHEGHIHLIKACQSQTGLSICSIFVNPSQFNDPRDFEKYPVSIEKDIEMLVKACTNVVFLPSVTEIYPHGFRQLEDFDLGGMDNVLEGRFRPGHFQGVCQVMSRLLKIVKPDYLFMGQKDFQQCLIVKRLIAIMGLPVRFCAIPTVREPDGLALSSRNRRLTPDQRINAVAISQALKMIREKLAPGSTGPLIEMAKEKLDAAHFKTDYISIARPDDLEPIHCWNGKEQAVALIAAFQGEVRLIDNILIN